MARIATIVGGAAFAAALCLGAAGVRADVVAVVSPQSSVTSLSKAQIADIFLGKATRFPDGKQAMPIDQLEGTAVRDDFYLKFAGQPPAQLKAHWSKIIFTGRGQPPPEVRNSEEVKKRVGANPDAIGYIDQSVADDSIRILHLQ